MARTASWSQALAAAVAGLPAEPTLSALLAIRPAPVRRQLARLMRQKQADAVRTLASSGIPEPIVRTVAALAGEDPELRSLPGVIDGTIDRLHAAGHGTAVLAESATPLPPAAAAELAHAVGRAHPAPVVVDYAVVPRLVGGIRLTLGTQRIDRSVRTRLGELRRAIQS